MTVIRNAVARFAGDLPRGGSVLDVGCGLRPYEDLFEGVEYLGIDVAASGREEHEKRVDAWFDGTSIPFEGGRFDGALCTQVLEHAVDPHALVADIFRVVRPGGALLVTVPFIWGEHEMPYDFRRFSRNGVRALLEGAGFLIEEQQRLVAGIDAIEMLVASEINNFVHNVDPARLERRSAALAARLSEWLWRMQLGLWRRVYRFERIYVDNLVIARRPA